MVDKKNDVKNEAKEWMCNSKLQKQCDARRRGVQPKECTTPAAYHSGSLVLQMNTPSPPHSNAISFSRLTIVTKEQIRANSKCMFVVFHIFSTLKIAQQDRWSFLSSSLQKKKKGHNNYNTTQYNP
jgi:hypothetical protein